MDVWPNSIVQEVAERRAIFVLGAGVSIGCADKKGVTPPSWKDLLEELIHCCKDPKDQRYASSLIRQNKYLDAAEVIEISIPRSELSSVLTKRLKKPKFQPSKIHNAIIEMDPKVVVTTNYDMIYENACQAQQAENGHVVGKYYGDQTLNNLRSSQRCVLKMHGCISEAAKVVLSKTSYFNARRENPGFYKVLDALFLVNTIIFIGCSMDDPDLQILLENTQIGTPSEHSHFAIMEKVYHSAQRKILKTNYNIELLEYPKNKHERVTEMIIDLKNRVDSWRQIYP